MSQTYPCGVDGRAFDPHGRDCPQVENVPPGVAQAAQTVVAIEFYDPQNVILETVYNLAQNLNWQDIANQLAKYLGPLIISALAS